MPDLVAVFLDAVVAAILTEPIRIALARRDAAIEIDAVAALVGMFSADLISRGSTMFDVAR